MRGASLVLGLVVVVGASAAACAEGGTPGFQNLGGGDGAGGEGGAGDGGDTSAPSSSPSSGTTSGQATGSATATTSVASSSSSGATTSSTTTSTSSSSTGSGGAPPCQHVGPGEPGNDTMASAHSLGTIGDSDGDGGTVAANLQTPTDVDWYFYLGEDNFGSSVDPTRQVVGAGIRVCKYIQCVNGEADFDCPSDAQPDTQGGYPGCCWNGPDEHTIGGFNCVGPISDDSRVYIRIDHEGGTGCENYTLKYHY